MRLGLLLMVVVVTMVTLFALWSGPLSALLGGGGLGIALGWRWGRRSRLSDTCRAEKGAVHGRVLGDEVRRCPCDDVDAKCGAANACLHICSLCEKDHPAVGG